MSIIPPAIQPFSRFITKISGVEDEDGSWKLKCGRRRIVVEASTDVDD